MIEHCSTPGAARAWCASVRANGQSLGFVATMGALHTGHMALVERACAENDRVCASVFVNPLQFNEAKDLEDYPHEFESDRQKLMDVGCAMVFTGTLSGFFPDLVGADGDFGDLVLRDPGPGALGLEGVYRHHHLAGVATIVRALFEVSQPTRAYFGQKDFQQCLVVQHVADELGGEPEIVVCRTVREDCGIALSSRNLLLTDESRAKATAIPRALHAARAAWNDGVRNGLELAHVMQSELVGQGLDVEYAEVRDPAAWTEAQPDGELARGVALIAAKSDGVRLIDNLVLSPDYEA